MLQIYNTLTRRKEPLAPLVPGKVRMYVCGMTVYDYSHIGHARVMIVFDMAVRYMRHVGLDVTYIRNITDIDDKIIKRANDNKEPMEALTARFIAAMNEDAAALGVLPPDSEPRATVHMKEILAMIGLLIDRGYAYVAANKDVYYRVRKFEGYGRLSGKSLDELQSGARVEIDEQKEDPLDFVLWKAAKPGEPSWESPWGRGRPGWHIECSAMSTACLGNHFDIHGGGMDLTFPHHENEIAQSEGATGEHFVNTWMHVGFVRVNTEKMSKSLGNFFTVREVLAKYDPEVVRYFILASHYRSPLDYSDDNLQAAKSALTSLYTALRGVPIGPVETDSEFADRFRKAMDDDFNTAEAIAVLFDLAHAINRTRTENPSEAARLARILRSLAVPLGLLQRDADQFLKGGVVASEGIGEAEIEALIAKRSDARQRRDWGESDRIRDELMAKGVVLEDVASGRTTWRRV